MAELKPCPFCGGEAKYVELYANDKTGESCGYVRCSRIIPCVAQPNVRSKKTVYKKWNKRTEPERPKGRWIWDKRFSDYTCSVCHNWDLKTPNFCSNCGADMRGESE